MTKQEEIREGMAEIEHKYVFPFVKWADLTNDWKDIFRNRATDMLAYLHSQGAVPRVKRELPIEENNMGNMSKAEVVDFFTCVTADLGLVLALEFTPTSPSIYLGDKILFCEKDLNGYKWQAKERILHEIAHHFEVGKRQHGTNFYKVYAELISRYLAGYVATELLIEQVKELNQLEEK